MDGIGASWQHIDGLRDLQLREPSSSVHQHEALRSKFASLNRTINKCDLHVRFPDEVRVIPQGRDNGQATHDIRTSGANENGNEEEIEVATPAIMPTPMTPFGNSAPAGLNGGTQYKPILVKLWFKCVRPALGFRFSNVEDNARYPHAYTVNHPVPCSTSLWLPCLDGIWERSTWEFSISVPKTLGDIRKRATPKSTFQVVAIAEGDEGSDLWDSLEMKVVCSADLVDEKTSETNTSCKVVSFAQSSPVGASHMGFAVGPFEQFNLTDFRDNEEDEMMGSSAVDIHGYCLPPAFEDMKNTCHPLYKAMDFFVKEYGSFPFTNYQVCFVEGLEADAVSTAGMATCADRLLYSARLIDPVYSVTKALTIELASQWIGINIVPRSWSDTWLMIGIARYITGLFLRQLMGNNDYRYRLKRDIVKITEQDIGRAPISSRELEIPIDPEQTRFISLKAPLVLHMLDQRLTKAGSSLGLRRVIPRIFLQALSGELANGILSTEKFLRQCEKTAHIKLEEFSRQWITGHGYPIFSVVQRYNKKKMMIEMGIRQQQFQDTPRASLSKRSFIDDAHRAMTKDPIGLVDTIFTGSIAIRLHEADGTPYEHIIDLKDQYHKFDIPYNNKYRKRVRGRRNPKVKVDGDQPTDEFDDDPVESDHINCLGDGFQSEQDHRVYDLEDWSKEDEDKMSGEAFEWLRIDADFEWICKLQVGQPDYMYHSQLQQDRDVVAQVEALQYFASSPPSRVLSSIMFRTIMDDRYFYGIRQLAAQILVQCATPELNMLGRTHLVAIFRHLYCFSDSTKSIPCSNDFTDFAHYFVRQTILEALVATCKQDTSMVVRSLLVDQLLHNDNSDNPYDDSHYLSLLIKCMTSSTISQHVQHRGQNGYRAHAIEGPLAEIERCQRMDRWRPSFQNLISQTALQCKEMLMSASVLPVSFKEFMEYTREDYYYLIRQQAYTSMLSLGALRSTPLGRYILYTIQKDPSPYIRHRLSLLVKQAFGTMALQGKLSEVPLVSDVDAMIVEEDTSASLENRKNRESRLTMDGAVTALRDEFGNEETLKIYMWKAVNDWKLAPLARRNLLDICKVLYESKESRILKLKLPSMKARVRCFNRGAGKLVIKKTRPLEKYQKKAPIKPLKIKIKPFQSDSRLT